MITLLILTIALVVVSFVGGFYAGVKNADSKRVALAKAVGQMLKK